jgi:prefoldin subunit 5
MCDVLQAALKAHDRHLRNKIATIDRQIQDGAATIDRLRHEISQRQHECKQLSDRLAYLDQPEPETQRDLDGIASHTYEHKLLSLTPTFRFSVKTRFPIRHHTLLQSPGLRWDEVKADSGSFIFTAKAKPKAFRNGFAQVTIYGWRREMFAQEIGNIRKNITSLNTLIQERKDFTQATDMSMNTLHQIRKLLTDEFAVCNGDTATVLRMREMVQIPAPMYPYLDVQSLYGIAKHLGLASQAAFARTAIDPANSSHKLALRVARLCSEEIQAALDTHASHRLLYVSRSTSSLCSVADIDKKLRCTLNLDLKTEEVSSKADPCASDGEQALHFQVLKKELNAMEASWEAGIDALRKSLSELEFDIPSELQGIKALQEGHSDISKDETALSALHVELIGTSKSIGAAAAIMAFPDTTEAILSIYRGERIRLDTSGIS